MSPGGSQTVETIKKLSSAIDTLREQSFGSYFRRFAISRSVGPWLVFLQILIRNIVLGDLAGMHFFCIFIVGRLHTCHRTCLKDVSLFD